MPPLAVAVLVAHFGLLTILCAYGLHRLYLIALRARRGAAEARPEPGCETLPRVTVQVPLYNERFVAGRIVHAVAAFEYPPERLQIQILDDSDDATTLEVASLVRRHQAAGIPIEHVRRADRTGFKAGALAAGMRGATGDLIAVFDADFVPSPGLLRETVPYFRDPAVGMVQLRWEHLNRSASVLTEVQALRLDAHFGIEQSARCAAGLFFNFNGTAGLWRADAIREAGNWQADTLTEDLDLSYRAQLCGWRFLYLPHVCCPGELPADFNAFKSQQHRWAKGAIQVFLKLWPTIWRSGAPRRVRIDAGIHLSSNLSYLVMLVDTVFLLVPSLLLREHYGLRQTLWLDLPMLLLSSAAHLCFFLAGQVATGRSVYRALRFVPALMTIGVGIAMTTSWAVAEALLGRQSAFVRTPKQGSRVPGESRRRTPILAPYRAVPPKGVRADLALGAGYGLVLLWALARGLWVALPFLLLLHLGFLTSALWSLREQRAPAARE